MLNSNEFLASCSKLKECGLVFPVKIGCRLARGFADLGYEEFYLLPANKLLSIYTAKTSEWSVEQEKHFFVVPDVNQLIAVISAQKIKVKVEYQNAEWVITFANDQQEIKQSGTVLINLLIRAYLNFMSEK